MRTQIAGMTTLRNCYGRNQHGRNEKGILPDSRSGLNTLAWLKGIALDPCHPKASQESFQKLSNQSLKLRKSLFSFNGEYRSRKRKFERLAEGTKMTTASTLTLKDFDNQNSIELGNTQLYDASRVPKSGEPKCCNQRTVLNSHSWRTTLTFGDTFRGKYVNTDITYKHDGTRCSSMSMDFPPSNDNDEYLTGSNSLSWEDITTKGSTPTNFNDMVQSSESSSAEVSPVHKKKLRQHLGIIDSVQKPAAVADFLDSAVRSISRDDCHPRPVIPIGPNFQAKVPGWIGPNRKNNIQDGDVDDLETLKWLGTQIWPSSSEGKSLKPTAKAVGKRRHELCSCASPVSISCNRRHVLESRLLLKSEIGPAFLSWKFDKMGEAALKAWTSEEQRRFESLVKTNPLTRVTNFWELALKHFPSKSKKSLLIYYYNVYIPRSMRLQTISSLDD